jgi:hypothetical protein
VINHTLVGSRWVRCGRVVPGNTCIYVYMCVCVYDIDKYTHTYIYTYIVG